MPDDLMRRDWTVTATALIGMLWWDGLRVWLPSILFIVADAGETSAIFMGAVALSIAAIPLIVCSTVPTRVHARSWPWLLVVLLAGRIGLQLAGGGITQFLLASTTVVASVVALAFMAAHSQSGQQVRLGLLVGIAASTILFAWMGGTDLVWHGSMLAWLTVAALVIATWLTGSQLPNTTWQTTASAFDRRGPAWPWWSLGVVVLLLGILITPLGRIATATGWNDPIVAAVVTALLCALIVGFVSARRFASRMTAAFASVAVVVGVIGALRADSTSAVLAQAVLALALGLFVGMTTSAATASPRRHAVAVGGMFLVYGVLGFGYYAPYDLNLPYSPRAVLLAAVILLAFIGVSMLRGTFVPAVRELVRYRQLVALVAGCGVLAGIGYVVAPNVADEPIARSTDDTELRVVLYNIHMGFDTSGQLSTGELARAIAEHQPDIVVLNETDRGWMTTGGRDNLRLIQRELGFDYVFAPAADDIWGNAVLSRFPITSSSVERLPRGRDAMMRSLQTAIVDLGDDRQVAIVGTHLSHVDVQGDTRIPQVRSLVATVARLRDRGLPIVVAGDLNAGPASPELQSFSELLMPALPDGTPTFPSWDPQVQIDHILVSSDFDVMSYHVFDNQMSDHLGIAVDLKLVS